MSLLDVRGVTRRFGGLTALDGVDLAVDAGEITALIGPNGAGKTTLFNCITGALSLDAGTVVLDGLRLDGLEVHERAAAGLGRTFQRLEVFANMTVFENLQVAAEARQPGRVFRGVLQLRARTDPAVTERVEQVLERVGLADVARARAGELSTGRLRLLELGRTLCTGPRVLLLDEPASGLDTDETAHLDGLLRDLATEGLGILLIEHDIDLVLGVSAIVHCLHFGRLIARGTPDEVADDPGVRAAYLGTGREAADVGAAPA